MSRPLTFIGRAFLILLIFGFLNPTIIPSFYNFDKIDRATINIHPSLKDTYKFKNSNKLKSIKPEFNKRYYSLELTEEDQLQELKKTLGVTWDSFFPRNSHEDTLYIMSFYSNDNIVKPSILMTMDEFGSGGVTPARIRKYLKNIEANK